MVKFEQFFNKNSQSKNMNSFLSKKYSQNSSYLVIMNNLTHLQGRNTTVKFMSRIFGKFNIGSEIQDPDPEPSEKSDPDRE